MIFAGKTKPMLETMPTAFKEKKMKNTTICLYSSVYLRLRSFSQRDNPLS